MKKINVLDLLCDDLIEQDKIEKEKLTKIIEKYINEN